MTFFKFDSTKFMHKESFDNTLRTIDVLKSISILITASLIGFIFHYFGFSEANIITVYILGVLIIAMVCNGFACSLFASFISVLVFNYLFTVPRFTFNAYDKGYPVTFLIMFAAAFITSTLVMQIKKYASHTSLIAYRSKILLETNQLLLAGKSKDAIINVISSQLMKLLDRDIIFYLNEKHTLKEPIITYAHANSSEKYLNENEKAVAQWVFINHKHAGATTHTLRNATCLYLAIRLNSTIYGVVGIAIENNALDAFEKNVTLAILGDCALALENEQTTREKTQSELIAKNEKLRANLLRSISHDLRTPLTSISGNAGILLNRGDRLDVSKKMTLYKDIFDDAKWLINLVENLLSITRIEDGSMHIQKSSELIEEIILEALTHIHKNHNEHTIKVVPQNSLLMAKMDAHLIVQVIVNIIDNAIKYTPLHSEISISSGRDKNMIFVEIADTGNGIPDASKEKIFDMFYRDNTKIIDSRRSLGLGLFLCKSIIVAHGGVISVRDRAPKGAIFRFTLPHEEVTLHE